MPPPPRLRLLSRGDRRPAKGAPRKGAAALTDDGWSAEIALPFKTLPFDPNVKAWGFNVNRAIRGRAEEGVWVARNRAWGPTITGLLTGIENVDRGLGLDIVPTLGLRSMRYYAQDHTDEEAKPSLDLYYRLTPSLSASLTLNTDFSATDADDRQVNLTRFSLFFPEKRDFFLENGGEKFARIDCLNDSAAGLDVIETVVRRELRGWAEF